MKESHRLSRSFGRNDKVLTEKKTSDLTLPPLDGIINEEIDE